MFLFFAKKWDRMENTSIKTHIFDVDACTVVLFQNILRIALIDLALSLKVGDSQ